MPAPLLPHRLTRPLLHPEVDPDFPLTLRDGVGEYHNMSFKIQREIDSLWHVESDRLSHLWLPTEVGISSLMI